MRLEHSVVLSDDERETCDVLWRALDADRNGMLPTELNRMADGNPVDLHTLIPVIAALDGFLYGDSHLIFTDGKNRDVTAVRAIAREAFGLLIPPPAELVPVKITTVLDSVVPRRLNECADHYIKIYTATTSERERVEALRDLAARGLLVGVSKIRPAMMALAVLHHRGASENVRREALAAVWMIDTACSERDPRNSF